MTTMHRSRRTPARIAKHGTPAGIRRAVRREARGPEASGGPEHRSDERILAELLARRSECCRAADEDADERHDERVGEVDRRICRRFERRVAVFVLDMAGFTRITVARGILHYLMMIHRMRELCTPLVRRHRGVVVKTDADNLFAHFPTVRCAVDASLDILDRLGEANLDTDDESDVHVSVGIGWGPTLVLDRDLWGSEFNLAAKLGEDIAGANEIWLTGAARRALPPGRTHRFRRRALTLSGMPYTAWLLRPHAPR
jgi:class 3 adenylate cyclase